MLLMTFLILVVGQPAEQTSLSDWFCVVDELLDCALACFVFV